MGSPRTSHQPKRGSPSLRVPVWYYAILGVITVVGAALIVISLQSPEKPELGDDLISEDDYILGQADAPVTVIEWASLDCEPCLAHVVTTMPQLQQEYVEPGTVRYVFRPLVFDEANHVAAEALYCAGEQGHFWEMRDWLFRHSSEWTAATDAAQFLAEQTARVLGLDGTALEDCLRAEQYSERVDRINAEAMAMGVSRMPFFRINHTLLAGAYPLDVFRPVIDLAQKGDYAMGEADAPVIIMEWSRPTCGYCRQYSLTAKPLIETQFVETGQVRYIFRPYVGDDFSRLVAESVYCAGDQGKFWEMHEWTFANVERLVESADLVQTLAEEGGAELGLDTAVMRDCLLQGRHQVLVAVLQADASLREIPGTPSFLINGRPLAGAYPFETFKQMIEEELSP